MIDVELDAKTIFYRFLEEDPQNLDDFLKDACGDHPTLRDEVEHLISCYNESDTFFDNPVLLVKEQSQDQENEDGLSPSTLPMSSRPRNDAWPEIPGYSIEGELGRGGMGIVYLARQLKVNRLVALKVILGQTLASDDERKRFQIEAEAIAKLQHPGIVQIFEIGEGDDYPYFSLEYCAGGGLDNYLAGVPLTAREAAQLVKSLANAIQVAHQAKILHRDLKPANVLLSPRFSLTESMEPEMERRSLRAFSIKLTDFSLAKKLDEPSETKTGMIMGTPSYMAPEQLQSLNQVEYSVDIYGLGAILYECLTGKPPFRATSAWETIEQVKNTEVVAPTLLQPTIPIDLETICLKCLHKDAIRRYQSAQELADDLQRYIDNKPIQARPVGTVERTWRSIQRNPLVSSLVLIIFLILVAGITSTAWGWIRAETNAEAANEQKKIALQEKANALVAETQAKSTAAREKKAREQAENANFALSMKVAHDAWYDNQPKTARALFSKFKSHSRQWEYRYLNSLFFHRGRIILKGHKWPVTQVQFSPDGKFLVSQSIRELFIWDVDGGVILHQIPLQPRRNRMYFFDPKSSRVALADASTIIGIWDLQSGRSVPFIENGKEYIIPVLLYDKKLKTIVNSTIPNTPTTKETVAFLPTLTTLSGICLSSDRQRILICNGIDKQIQLWDAIERKAIRTLKKNGEFPRSLSFCGNRGIAVWLEPRSGLVPIYDTRSGKRIATLRDPLQWIQELACSPNGELLATVTNRGVDPRINEFAPVQHITPIIRLWDVKTRSIQTTLRGASDEITSIVFSPDGQFLATPCKDKAITLWKVREASEPLFINHRQVESFRFSPDGNRVITTGKGKNVKIFDSNTGELITEFQGKSRVSGVDYSPDGEHIVTAEREVILRDAQTGQEQFTFKMGQRMVYNVAFSPTGKYLAAHPWMKPPVKIWDLHTKELIFNLKAHSEVLAFSKDEKLLAFANQKGELKVYEIASKALILEKKQASPILAICFSPDGKLVVTGDDERKVKMWNVQSGASEHVLEGHDSRITGLCFTPDGSRLCSSSADGLIRFWEPNEGLETFILRARRGSRDIDSLRDIQFSSDGLRLGGVVFNQGIMIWKIEE